MYLVYCTYLMRLYVPIPEYMYLVYCTYLMRLYVPIPEYKCIIHIKHTLYARKTNYSLVLCYKHSNRKYCLEVIDVRFEILTAVKMTVLFFWFV
jgi:hypothetical protein